MRSSLRSMGHPALRVRIVSPAAASGKGFDRARTVDLARSFDFNKTRNGDRREPPAPHLAGRLLSAARMADRSGEARGAVSAAGARARAVAGRRAVAGAG